MKSQKLWEEIKFVLDNFAAPFTDLANATMGLAKQHAANPQALKVIFGSLVQIARIFYYLNYQVPFYLDIFMSPKIDWFFAFFQGPTRVL